MAARLGCLGGRTRWEGEGEGVAWEGWRVARSGGEWQRSGVNLKYKRIAGGEAAAVHLKGL